MKLIQVLWDVTKFVHKTICSVQLIPYNEKYLPFWNVKNRCFFICNLITFVIGINVE
jgi:hypothetical protein